MKTRKLISLFLTLTMLCSCIVISPFATAQSTTVYVNGELETNGTGTKDSPFNTIANAVKALQNSGGTIVVMGNTALTNNAFTNSAKITVTAHDGTTDYRGAIGVEDNTTFTGGCLTWSTGAPYDFGLYSGEVEFKNLNLVWFARYSGLNLHGRTFTLGEGVKWYEQKTATDKTLVDDYSESVRLYDINTNGPVTKNGVTVLNISTGTKAIKVIAGARCEMTTAGHIFNVDGYIKELHLSSESNNNTRGKLIVDGDVKINLGSTGTIAKLTVATAGSGNTKGLANQKLLE